jgi:ferritin-like metal-binding protein YciE
MANTTTHAVLSDWVGDIVAIESHIEEALDRQLKLDGAPDVIQQVHDSVRASKQRAEEFRKSYDEAGGQSVIQKGAEILGKAAGVIDMLRKDTVSKALRDDFVACNLGIASYTMLHTTAIALEDGEVAAFAASGLRTYGQLVMDISNALPNAVVSDLTGNQGATVKDPNAGSIAASQQREIWAQLAQS